MILMNPAAMRDSLFVRGLLAIVFICAGLSLTAQGVTGIVREGFSRQPVAGARVRIYAGDRMVMEAATGISGEYTALTSFAGRVRLEILADGYKLYLLDDILLDGYTTHSLEHAIETAAYDLKGVTVTASAAHQAVYIRTIRPADLVLTAGHYDDPVRVALSEPGLVLLNDQANHFSSRGQSPVFNKWYLEGLEIVNPNHTNNAGTLSDLPTPYGGGVNMFSAQILGQTDIYTGAHPLAIKSNGGAVVDMHLHETVRPEWRIKAGLLGFEAGGGAVFGDHGVLDVNLRYSFTGLLADLGVDFGGEKIGYYDGVISYRHQGARHKLKIFAWGGRSANRFAGPEEEDERKRYKDFFDIDYENNILGAGLRYNVALGQSLYLQSGAAWSANTADHRAEGRFSFPVNTLTQTRYEVLSGFADVQWSPSAVFQTGVGVQATDRDYVEERYDLLPFTGERYIRPYMYVTWQPYSRLKLETGGELHVSLLEPYSSAGYRAVATFLTDKKTSFFVSAQSGAGEPIRVQTGQFRSNRYETGMHLAGKRHYWTINAYYHTLTGLRGYRSDAEGNVYHMADFPYSFIGPTFGSYGDGQSRQYGIEGQWKYIHPGGWRMGINQSLFKSERRALEEPFVHSRYDSRIATHLTFSKEMLKEKKGKNRIWNFSIRGMLLGGLWEAPIDVEASDQFESTIYRYPGHYMLRLPVYTRIDAGIARTIAQEKMRWRYALDIQNVAGLKNTAFHYYDPFLKEIVAQPQLGVIPVLSVQASW